MEHIRDSNAAKQTSACHSRTRLDGASSFTDKNRRWRPAPGCPADGQRGLGGYGAILPVEHRKVVAEPVLLERMEEAAFVERDDHLGVHREEDAVVQPARGDRPLNWPCRESRFGISPSKPRTGR